MTTVKLDKYFWQNNKVRLRPLKEDDWEQLNQYYFDSEAKFYLYGELPFPASEVSIKNFIKNNSTLSYSSSSLHFIIENLKDENVGFIFIHSIDEKNGTFGTGIQVGKDYQGNGYGAAAMDIIFKYAFFERRLNKFDDIILEGNIPSKKMFEKLGCKCEGVRRQQIFSNGRYYDEHYYGLLKEEYISE